MRFAIVVTVLLSTLTTSCQSSKNLFVDENISEINFEVNEEKLCLIELSIDNQGEEDLALWIAKNKESDLMNYLLKNRGDFNLLNLISEKILKPNNQIVFKSFFKILRPEERFSLTILINNPDDQKVATSKNFIQDCFKYAPVKKLEELITKEHYSKSSFGGNMITLPYDEIVE